MQALKFSSDRCTACQACQVACSVSHNGAYNYHRTRIVIEAEYPATIKATVCKQCKKPMCVKSCPTGSLTQQEDGMVAFDESLCTKCYLCVEGCPFDAMFIDEATGLPMKCDLCGGDPQCVKHCYTKAIRW